MIPHLATWSAMVCCGLSPAGLGRPCAYDGVGRFGGEELLIVFPGCDVVVSAKLAERLRARVRRAPQEDSGLGIHVTLSLGVAAAATAKASHLDVPLRAADGALYRAKNAGRNRLERATASDLAFSTGVPAGPGD